MDFTTALVMAVAGVIAAETDTGGCASTGSEGLLIVLGGGGGAPPAQIGVDGAVVLTIAVAGVDVVEVCGAVVGLVQEGDAALV